MCSQAAQGVPGTADVQSLGVGSRAELRLEWDSWVLVQAWGSRLQEPHTLGNQEMGFLKNSRFGGVSGS